MNLRPDHTAVRVALWRALHAEIDPDPIFRDEIGASLVGESDWRSRQDMNPDFSKPMRASIASRARFVEDLLAKKEKAGARQYVILGAGLDTFAQRNPKSGLKIFEVDRPETQDWKIHRLKELGLPSAKGLSFVPVNFETDSWWQKLLAAGFDASKPAVFASTGVSLYLSEEANQATLDQLAKLAPGSAFATTFLLSLELLDSKERSLMEFVMKKAAEGGTPFLSLFEPEKILSMARSAGFKSASYVSSGELFRLYLSKRTDSLRAGNAEAFLLAET